MDVDAPLAVGLEINAAVAQQLDAVLSVHVLVDVELPEVELPGAVVAVHQGQPALRVAERQAQLLESGRGAVRQGGVSDTMH